MKHLPTVDAIFLLLLTTFQQLMHFPTADFPIVTNTIVLSNTTMRCSKQLAPDHTAAPNLDDQFVEMQVQM